METPPKAETAFEYSMQGFDINEALAAFNKACETSQPSEADYDTELTSFAEQSLAYLTEGLQRFPQDFNLDIEAEFFAHSLTGRRKEDFAVRFNSLLYESISDPVRSIDAITNRSKLQNVVELTAIADRINSSNFYERPNRVRELGDAIVGRATITMLSFNQDPRFLRIPIR